jgi:hypothetical protein
MKFDTDFNLLVAAAVAGQRCPMSNPHGPLKCRSITELVREGKIRSEVYTHNYRVVTILAGPHRGAATAPAPRGAQLYVVNGRRIGRFAR